MPQFLQYLGILPVVGALLGRYAFSFTGEPDANLQFLICLIVLIFIQFFLEIKRYSTILLSRSLIGFTILAPLLPIYVFRVAADVVAANAQALARCVPDPDPTFYVPFVG